jgi:hypothetical protein
MVKMRNMIQLSGFSLKWKVVLFCSHDIPIRVSGSAGDPRTLVRRANQEISGRLKEASAFICVSSAVEKFQGARWRFPRAGRSVIVCPA